MRERGRTACRSQLSAATQTPHLQEKTLVSKHQKRTMQDYAEPVIRLQIVQGPTRTSADLDINPSCALSAPTRRDTTNRTLGTPPAPRDG
jgi:hypothetical protein